MMNTEFTLKMHLFNKLDVDPHGVSLSRRFKQPGQQPDGSYFIYESEGYHVIVCIRGESIWGQLLDSLELRFAIDDAGGDVPLAIRQCLQI